MHTWVEISKKAIQHNLDSFRSMLPKKTALAAVVKSNAYGHDIRIFSRLALEAGADLLAVNSIEEALLMKSLHPQTDILVMGVISPIERYAAELNSKNFIIISSSVADMEYLQKHAPRAKLHLKTDTGMGRLGIREDDLSSSLEILKKKRIKISGIATHFASTEDFTEHSYSQKQLESFNNCIAMVKKKGFKKLTRHCASSASTMLFAQAHMDMVRIGISMYGLWPSLQTKLSLSLLGKNLELKPVLSWKTRIVYLNELPEGSYVGYGSTYKTTHKTKVAVIPVGYNEGLDRKMSNSGYVLIRGEKVRIIGRVCMNMTMVDATSIAEVSVGDEVVIIGKSGDEYISADEIAAQTGTINYEVVTRIHKSIPKIETEE